MTDTSKREELIRAVQSVTWNASNYPPKIQPHVLGQDIVPLTMKIVDAVEAVFEQAHTPTDDEREAARAYADAEYPELRLAPENEDRADIAERAFLAGAGFRRTAGPTDDERGALRVASPVTWGWDACVVCGSKDVTDRGMVVMVSKADGAYVGRVAWCDGSQECRDDLRQAGASMLTEDQAEAVDAALRHSPAPTDDEREALMLAGEVRSWADSRKGWNQYQHDMGMRVVKTLNALLARRTAVQGPSAEESDLPDGHAPVGQLSPFLSRRVQGEPTDAQVREEVDRREEYAEAHGHPAFQDEGSAFIDGAEWMRAALRAAHEEGKKR